MTVPTLSSGFAIKPPAFLINPTSVSRHLIRFRAQTVPFPSKVQAFNPWPTHHFLPLPGERSDFYRNWASGFLARVANGRGGWEKNGNGDSGVDEERLAMGESTMPERFRYLTKEAPDPPVRWPWFVALAFLVYAWRAVLFELTNWRKAAFSIVRFVGYIIKLALALVFHFIGDPITSTIRCLETAIYSIRAFYSAIVGYAPVWELTVIIILASAVLAIAEATVPNAISSQPYMLTAAGLIGYAAVSGYISEPLLWTLLLGLYGFSRIVKKRDDVTSALPVAALMAAIGEPWVRVLVMSLYLALAIFHHSKKRSKENGETAEITSQRQLPLPLLGAGLAIGIRFAAKWAGYRHLTWMVV